MMGFGGGEDTGEHERRVRTAGYDGPERRIRAPNGRRPGDVVAGHIKTITAVWAIIAIILSAGVAVGTANMVLASKVDRVEFLQYNAQQDKDRLALKAFIDSVARNVGELTPVVRELNGRLRDIYCDGKPPSCR